VGQHNRTRTYQEVEDRALTNQPAARTVAHVNEVENDPVGRPADIGSRITAGVFDLFLLSLLGATLSLAPMLFGGLALPLVGAVAAIVVYTIAPAMLFRQTLGMKLFGVEIISVNGRNADATELLFRELFGRGLFGAAYFASVAVGIFGYLSGSLSFFQPTGPGLVLFLVAGAVSFIGVVGHFLILASKDRRGLGDLMARTIVIEAGSGRDERAFEAEMDDEERAMASAKRKKRIRNFVLFEAGMLAGALLLPYFLSRPVTSHEEFAERMEQKKAEREFKQDPTNSYRAHNLISSLRASGDLEKADEILTQHQEAIQKQENAQESALRVSLKERPDWDTLGDLLRLLEKQGRIADAKTTFAEYAAQDRDPDTRAAFGIWLYEHDFVDESIGELRTSITAGATGAGVHAYLGFALQDKGEKQGAIDAFKKALEIDPELYEAKAELEALSH
jgi:uncharacterized RDD family membrane protein YckC